MKFFSAKLDIFSGLFLQRGLGDLVNSRYSAGGYIFSDPRLKPQSAAPVLPGKRLFRIGESQTKRTCCNFIAIPRRPLVVGSGNRKKTMFGWPKCGNWKKRNLRGKHAERNLVVMRNVKNQLQSQNISVQLLLKRGRQSRRQ